MSDSDDGEQDKRKYSPAGFEAPEPEIDDKMVVCAGCGESSPASEMGVTGDNIVWNGDGAVMEVRRCYIHNNEECMLQAIESGLE